MRTAALPIVSLLLLACGPKDAPPTQPPASPAATAEVEEPEAAPVAAIPQGMFTLTPQLVVPDVDAAITFYGQAFGAEPGLVVPDPTGKTMHGEVKIGDSVIMLDAENPMMKSPKSLGGTTGGMMVYVEDVDAAFKRAVDAGATVETPPTDMFWGDRFAELVDPAGHKWGLSAHVEDLTQEQLGQRAAIAAKAHPTGKKKLGKKALAKIEAEWKAIVGTPAKSPIPERYHTVTLGLTVNDAAAALKFYTEVLGAQEIMRLPRPDGAINHAEIMLGDSILMLNDEHPDLGSKAPKTLGAAPMMVHHYVADSDTTFAKAVQAGASPAIPLNDSFWGDRYGIVAAPDGYWWGIATHVEDVPRAEMAERLKAMYEQKASRPAE